MSVSQKHLHSENFDLCRICLFEPESDRNIKFLHIFSPNNDGIELSAAIMEFFGVQINKDDVKPKIICQKCYDSILGYVEIKKRAAENQIVCNYIAKKRFSGKRPSIPTKPVQYVLPEAYPSTSKDTATSYCSMNLNQSTSSCTLTHSVSNSLTQLNIEDNANCSTNKDNHNQSVYTNQSTKLSMETDDDNSCEIIEKPPVIISLLDSDTE